MARCSCGGACQCALTAGTNATVTGSGTTTNPWVVSANTNCTSVRNCLTKGCGVTGLGTAADPIRAELSPDANNALECRGNGLYVTAGAGTVVSGCGLTGNGSAGDPVRINGAVWPHACDPDDVTTEQIYCDAATGQLHGGPVTRMRQQESAENLILADTAVPTGTTTTTVYTRSIDVTNTDPCRTARIILWRDLDVDFTLPPGGRANWALSGDGMGDLYNTGTTTMFDTHVQTGKVTNHTIPPGGTSTFTLDVGMSRGQAGATYNRIQTTFRAFRLETD